MGGNGSNRQRSSAAGQSAGGGGTVIDTGAVAVPEQVLLRAATWQPQSRMLCPLALMAEPQGLRLVVARAAPNLQSVVAAVVLATAAPRRPPAM